MNVLRFSLPLSSSISLRRFASIVRPMWCFIFGVASVFLVYLVYQKALLALLHKLYNWCLAHEDIENFG
jgi:hypothetical protein